MKVLKRIGITVGILFLVLIIVAVIFRLAFHEKRPEGVISAKADELAREMMESVNCAAWDSVEVISWTFSGQNRHLWDRKRHLDRIITGDIEVLIDLNSRWGIVKKNGEILEGKAAEKQLEKAWASWANDSFWLNPICKAFDEGTDRYLIDREDGNESVMVSYKSGGVTPGDSYLWILDENKRPIKWQMWVQIIPIGGVKIGWDDWKTLYNGALVASSHSFPIGDMKLELTEIESGTAGDMYKNGDPFVALVGAK